ncbi:hypothetical protein HB780_20980 [Rhizobium lusitanum]|uniref:hypothetical protein n=1 Tax=Rhizobium lusitanum TaxID=293958 RepID=UPI00161CDCA3|nr:hypothetical protein [Rhizobium lusitanum]QND46808.1 hypothetical protein HB780_20980 [Rhizobium lusitanum]
MALSALQIWRDGPPGAPYQPPKSDIREYFLWLESQIGSGSGGGYDYSADIAALDAELSAHAANDNNPHHVTKAQLGLGNVDNTSDADKPVSNATNALVGTAGDIINARPGDMPQHFVDTLAGGVPYLLAPLATGEQKYDENGRVLRLSGAAVVGTRTLYSLEPAKTYLVEFVVQRRSNSSDPSNDAVRCALAWYDQGANHSGTPQTVIQNITMLNVGSGRTLVSATVSRAAGTGIDIVSPADARYVRPYVQTYGTSPVTDIEIIRWEDITHAMTYAPDVDALEARIAAQEAIDADSRLDTLESQVTAPDAVRFKTVADLAAANVPESADVVELLGYYEAGDGGAVQCRRMAAIEAVQPGEHPSNSGSKRWGLVGSRLSALVFGVKGDGITDDSAAMLVSLNWFASASNLALIYPGNRSYRMASGILRDFSGLPSVGSLTFEGSIKPDAGIGRALTIRNARGGKFTCKVSGGGQTADYSVANPVGGDEAFAFVNVYASRLENIEGSNYQGRLLRITSDIANIGPDGFKTQWVDIGKIYFNSTAAITDVEATRMAQGVGQAFFIDSGTNAFGTITRVFGMWDLYGPVIENTSDVTFFDIESGWRGNSGMELRGVISFWGGKLKLGSEKGVGSPDLLRIIPSTVTTGTAVARAPQNIEIEHIFAVGGTNNVVITDVGTVAGQGIVIHSLNSRTSVTAGLVLNNVRKCKIGYESYADGIALITTGSTQRVDFLRFSSDASKLQTMLIGTGAAGINFFGGGAYNGNVNAVAATALCEINTTGRINFFGFEFSSANVDYLLKLVASSGVRLFGGQVTASGSSAVMSGQPSRANNVVGLTTAARGQVSVAAGATSVTIPHGLYKIPAWWDAKGNTAEAANPRVTADATNLTVTFPAPLVAIALVVWKGEADFAGT